MKLTKSQIDQIRTFKKLQEERNEINHKLFSIKSNLTVKGIDSGKFLLDGELVEIVFELGMVREINFEEIEKY